MKDVDASFGASERPHNIDAEQAVLGAVLFENALFDPLSDIIGAADFYEPTHGRLWTAIEATLARGEFADAITLSALADSDEGLQQLGGVTYLSELMAGASSVEAAPDYARFVADLSLRRRILKLCSRASIAALDGEHAARAALETLEAGLTAATCPTGGPTSSVTMMNAVSEAIERSAEARVHGHAPGAMLSGLDSLDDKTGGLRAGHAGLLAARPSIGKSALALWWALGAARGAPDRAPMRGLYWTPEMRAYEHASRAMAALAVVNYSRIDDGDLETYEFDRVRDAAMSISDLPIRFEEASSVTLSGLRRMIRTEMRRPAALPLGFVVIDPVGYLKVDGENETVRNNMKAEAIREMAGEFDLPILATHHLKKWEGHGTPRPTFNDIRDSGRWMDFFNLVLLLHRDSYYAETEAPPKDPLKKEQWEERCAAKTMEVIQAKRRGGARGAYEIGCNIALNKFWDLDPPRLTGVSA